MSERDEAAHLGRLLDTAEQDIAVLLMQREEKDRSWWRAVYLLTAAAGGKIVVTDDLMGSYNRATAVVEITRDDARRVTVVRIRP
jgi:hypothetical protein